MTTDKAVGEFVLVPTYPTDAMIAAAQQNDGTPLDGPPMRERTLERIYQTMLAAAPVGAVPQDLERMAVAFGDVQFQRGQAYAAVMRGDAGMATSHTNAAIRGDKAQAELVTAIRQQQAALASQAARVGEMEAEIEADERSAAFARELMSATDAKLAKLDELIEAATEVHRISERDHEAWHRLSAAIDKSRGEAG